MQNILIRLRARMILVLEGMRSLLKLEMQVPELHVELLVRAVPSNFNLHKHVLTKPLTPSRTGLIESSFKNVYNFLVLDSDQRTHMDNC
jgi:hypothetical protein